MKRQYKQVDVFTSVPFKGNPVAVVMDAKGLSTTQMQTIANWTNLSETTFVFPADSLDADYKVRIFTPGSELPFAGHPTIGTAFALLESGIISTRNCKVVQECAAGLIPLSVSVLDSGDISIAFELPKPQFVELSDEQVILFSSIIGCELDMKSRPKLVDVGARWVVARAINASAVIDATPKFDKLSSFDRALNATGSCIFGEYPTDSHAQIEVRSFAPSCGVNEDPVCGSGNGSVAAYIREQNIFGFEDVSVNSSQGQIMGREGTVNLTISSDSICVGGTAMTCIEGILRF